MMFLKSSVYVPFGKSKDTPYRPNPYDDEVYRPFDEIDIPQQYLEYFAKENSHLYGNSSMPPNVEDAARDDILEYILREYS